MNITRDNLDEKVIGRIPFLENFPFNEFSLIANVLSVPQKDMPPKEMDLVTFECLIGLKASINIFDKDIWFLNDIATSVKKLNDIKQIIDKGLSSEDILEKRDCILACEAWTDTFGDTSSAKFSFHTFGEILNGMLKLYEVGDPIEIHHKLNRLHDRFGIVKLDDEQEKLIISFYQFQLIYFKLILGIIIASKIST
jgi:hypothetical protein